MPRVLPHLLASLPSLEATVLNRGEALAAAVRLGFAQGAMSVPANWT
jgi:hypothetical protein